MLRQALRFVPVLLLGAVGAFAQGNFAHYTYGGGYTSTFTFVNQDTTTAAAASLYFYTPTGGAATVPILINGTATPTTSPYTFSIPANGAITIVLPAPTPDPGEAPGWAQLVVSNYVPVNGQLTFRRHTSGSPDTETVVPLSGVTAACLLPLPVSTPVTIIPFDNTTGQHGTAIALANTSASAQALSLEFDDQAGNVILTDTTKYTAFATLNHDAWLMTASYPATVNKVGTLKITGMVNSADLAVVALWFNTATNTLTTVLPITQ
jgi:hypothetical protein